MECDKKTVDRLKRANGQMNGILKMIEEGRSCQEIVTQLSALRSSIDKVIALITAENLMQTLGHVERNDEVQEALDLLVKSK